jgi:hypothetical protein
MHPQPQSAKPLPMREELLYTYSQSGRRPQTFFVTLLCVSMAGYGLWDGLPWFAMLPGCLACLAVGWPLFTNRQSGAILTRDTLLYFHGKKNRTIKLIDIASVERRSWSESPDDVALTLVSGEKVYLPSPCVDRGLDAALQKAGIFVRA